VLLRQALCAHQRALELRETCLDPDDPCIARSLELQASLIHINDNGSDTESEDDDNEK